MKRFKITVKNSHGELSLVVECKNDVLSVDNKACKAAGIFENVCTMSVKDVTDERS